MLELVGYAKIEIAIYALQELGVDKPLFLTESLFIAIGYMVAKTPEVIRIVTVGGLEAGDPVFPREEDGGDQHKDQLLAQCMQPQDINVGCPYRAVILVTGFEETRGNPA